MGAEISCKFGVFDVRPAQVNIQHYGVSEVRLVEVHRPQARSD
jgi:hypothetical protein